VTSNGIWPIGMSPMIVRARTEVCPLSPKTTSSVSVSLAKKAWNEP